MIKKLVYLASEIDKLKELLNSEIKKRERVEEAIRFLANNLNSLSTITSGEYLKHINSILTEEKGE